MEERIWIAYAPPEHTSFGPAVAYEESVATEWRNMGWIVTGPYVLEVPES
jgi:hypothetical protein